MKSLDLLLYNLLLFCCVLPSCTRSNSDAATASNLVALKDSVLQFARDVHQSGEYSSASYNDFLYNNASFHLAKAAVDNEQATVHDMLFMSNIAWQSGWYDQAYEYALKAKEMVVLPEDNAAVLLAEWQCYLNSMDTARSVDLLETIDTELDKFSSYPVQLQYKINLGYHFHNRKMYNDAINHYHQAAAGNARLTRDDSTWLASTYHKLANSFNDILRDKHTHIFPRQIAYDSARFYYNKAIEINQEILPKVHPRLAISYINLGLTERSNIELDKAESMYLKAFQHLVVDKHPVQPVYTSLAITQLAETYLKRYQVAGNDSDLEEAGKFFQYNNQFLRHELVTYSTNAGRENLLKYFNQRSFERVASLVGESYSDGSYPLNPALIELSNESKYAGTIKSYLQRQQNNNSDGEKDQVLRMLNELYIVAAQVEDTLLKQRVLNFVDQAVTRMATPVFEYQAVDTSALLAYCRKNNTTVVDYLIVADKMFIHRFSPAGAALVVRIVDDNILNEELPGRLYTMMLKNEVDSFQYLSNHCFKMLLDEAGVTGNNILVVPHQNLSLLPWDAFVTKPVSGSNWAGVKYISKESQLSQCISLSQVTQQEAERRKGIVGFLPQFDGRQRLPETQKLMKQLKAMYAASINEGEVSKTKVATTNAAIVHFATHTSTKGKDVKLQLDQKDEIDAYGSLGNLKADLVVLNACETHKGRLVQGEGFYNLPKVFIANGTGAVISSLWVVDEAASATFFALYYQHLAVGLSKDEALAKVKKQFLNQPKYPDWVNPYYWSAYVLTGNREPVIL
ncbi:CHAT domain-containing protein [Aridibaculum aurantiacum]|uniref:CHAT domain-containing protein n=1 Tax=Aridibaculum aurantiacum TaxID=2810307 RepID=UPI001A970177|nr:CHAT domain-containing tetratricopeptide repeat protein [Aridibaculum aurantiacum]